MFLRNQKSRMSALWAVLCLMMGACLVVSAASNPPQIASGQKAEVKGSIVSRNGDLIKVKEQTTGRVVIVNLIDGTDSQGRALNRRVDVKVLVNKGLAESM
jgi:hypothetical protein